MKCHHTLVSLYTGVLCTFYTGINVQQKRIELPTLISLINMEVGINVEVEGVQKLPNQETWRLELTWTLDFFWKKLVHNFNKRGVEGGKNLRNQYINVEGENERGGWIFFQNQ